jgi:hypothetical protein
MVDVDLKVHSCWECYTGPFSLVCFRVFVHSVLFVVCCCCCYIDGLMEKLNSCEAKDTKNNDDGMPLSKMRSFGISCFPYQPIINVK